MNINTISLRLILGVLAFLLPIVCLGLCVLYGYGIPDSISATYYLAPTITPAFLVFEKNTKDLYNMFPASISGANNISAFPAIG